MDPKLKQRLLASAKWTRALLMVLFVMIKYLVSTLINFIALFQFFHLLFLDQPNYRLLEFSQRLNHYLFQIINFLTFNAQPAPFPFTEWQND